MVCAGDLAAGSKAWWDANAKKATCLHCFESLLVPEPPEQSTDLTPSPLDRGTAGGSARAERVRRSDAREARVRARHPRLGGFLLAVSDDPTSTKVWDQGAKGEEMLGQFLEDARAQGIEALHDCRIPGSKANIDHLVIAPSGVWIVDAKRYLSGRLERREVGWGKKQETRLLVGGRDKTTLVGGVRRQMELVQNACEASGDSVPVHGALCFIEVEVGWFAKPFAIDGVKVTWRDHLLGPMLEPSVFSADQREELAQRMARAFPPKR